jgi:predicted PurR-regulated permease PerM
MFLIFLSAIAILALVVVSSFISAMKPLIKIQPRPNRPTDQVVAATYLDHQKQAQHEQKWHV